MSFIFNSSANNLSARMPVLKFDHMNQNQGRTFGPYFGLFLVNLLARMVMAKYASYVPIQLTYNPNSWLAYNRPLASYNHQAYQHNQWYPIENPYAYYQNYPPLTTATPYVQQQYPDYVQDYDYPSTQEPPNYEQLIPAESNHQEFVKGTTTPYVEKTATTTAQTTTPYVETTIPYVEETVVTTTPSTTTTTIEPVPAESNVKIKRQPTRYKKRGPSRRDPQRRRRTTTPPPPEYYDSYEDYTERYQPNKRRRPQPYDRDRPSVESYYEEDDYYDSFETTTRYYKKQKRRPTRRPFKNQNRREESVEIITTTERYNPNTEIVIVRQAQTTTGGTTTTTTTTTGGTTTTEPTTIVTNTTAAPSTTPGSNATYGYGPSNGNEQVSFTYGPPSGKYQYQIPYFDWYGHEATKNAIVRRVHDIVQTDKRLHLQ